MEATKTARYAIVVARYQEDIRWLSYLGRKPEWDVFVYNDGPLLDPYFTPNFTIHEGDHVPAEASKYLQFMCDNYDTIHRYEWIVFTQADPFVHSPDFIGLLQSTEHWEAPFQGLTNGAFPDFFSKQKISPKSSLNSFRVWNDCLSQNWVGFESHERPNPLNGAGSVSDFFDFYGAKLGTMKLSYCACFATTPDAIHTQTYETWNKLHKAARRNFEVIDRPHTWKGWVHTPNPPNPSNTRIKLEKKKAGKSAQKINIGKAFAFLMEYAWHPLLAHDAQEAQVPKIAVISACNKEYEVKDFFMNSLSCIPNSTHFHLDLHIPEELATQGFGFQKPSWYHCIYEHRRYAVEVMEKENDYDYYIVSDCDIQFLDNDWTTLWTYLKHSEKDVLYMREHTTEDVNTGFQVVKNKTAYMEFMKDILREERFFTAEYADQSLVNERKDSINYGYVPTSMTVWGQCFNEAFKSSYLLHRRYQR